MGEVINMHKETAIHPTVHNAILELDATIGECINDAIQAGVPILMVMASLSQFQPHSAKLHRTQDLHRHRARRKSSSGYQD